MLNHIIIPLRFLMIFLKEFYLVFAESHHALVGCISSGKDVWRVVGPLHTVV